MVNLYKDKYKQDDKILVLFNLEFIKALFKAIPVIKQEQVYFISDFGDKYDFVHEYFPNINVKELDWKTIEDLNNKIGEFNINKKFDIVFSNPPCNKNLDIKILNSIFNIANNIIFIHKSRFMFVDNHEALNYITNIFKKKDNLKEVKIFWRNTLFNIELFVPLCISYWNTNKKYEKNTH